MFRPTWKSILILLNKPELKSRSILFPGIIADRYAAGLVPTVARRVDENDPIFKPLFKASQNSTSSSVSWMRMSGTGFTSHPFIYPAAKRSTSISKVYLPRTAFSTKVGFFAPGDAVVRASTLVSAGQGY
jgi:hypothetical protein